MWCSSAVNRAPPFCRSAACRTRPSAVCTPSRPCVRSVVACGEFHSANRLPSSPSAARRRALFETFFGTTRLCDFPASSISGVRPQTSRCAPPPADCRRGRLGSPGSRARCFRACSGSSTPWGPSPSRAGDGPGVAFRIRGQRRHPRHGYFRGSIPGLHVPLPTLRSSLTAGHA